MNVAIFCPVLLKLPLFIRWDQAKDLTVRLIQRDVRQTIGAHDYVPDAAESFEQHFLACHAVVFEANELELLVRETPDE